MRRRTELGFFGTVLSIALGGGALYVACLCLGPLLQGAPAPTATAAPGATALRTPPPPPPAPASVTLGIALGSEKETWFRAAAEAFGRTPAGAGVKIELKPQGTLQTAQALLEGDRTIDAWAPASSVYQPVFERDWQALHHAAPFTSTASLALTPLVFVMWEERYQAFRRRFDRVSFTTLERAMAAEGGWAAMTPGADWGLFKFGHAHPLRSSSGLECLLLMANDVVGTHKALQPADLANDHFARWLARFEGRVAGLGASSAGLMEELVAKGPATLDAVCVYEARALEYLGSAQSRWGKLRAVYPEFNLWCDNPFCVLAAEWVSPAQRQAAEAFSEFLRSDQQQHAALLHGLRPAKATAALKTPDSPFAKCAALGFATEVSGLCDPPGAEGVSQILDRYRVLAVAR